MGKKDKKKSDSLTFASKFTNFEVIDSEFTKCRCYMLATGENINGSNFTEQSVRNAIARHEFDNKPIVAHLYQDTSGQWRVGGHDSKWVITNTSFEIVNECIPFGVIPESSNLQLERVLEPDGITTNTYLVGDVILWTGRYNIMDAAYSDDVFFNQSCEINMNDWTYEENGITTIKDFTFSALCLLNKSDVAEDNVRPCFPSCRVEKMSYSVDGEVFKRNFNELLERLQQYELAKDSDEDIDDEDEDENDENKDKDSKDSDDSEDKDSNDTKANDADFSLENQDGKGDTRMILSDFIEAFSDVKVEGTEVAKYTLLDCDENKVYAVDMTEYKPYGFDYAVTKDGDTQNIVVDFESGIEMDFAAKEQAEGQEASYDMGATINSCVDAKLTAITSTLEQEFNAKIEQIQAEYTRLVAEYDAAMEKVHKYEAIEQEQAKQEHRAEIESLFQKYSAKLGKCAEFLVYRQKVDADNVSTDDVDKKLAIMLGKYTVDSSKTKKNFEYQPDAMGIKPIKDETVANGRYGHLFDKFND